MTSCMWMNVNIKRNTSNRNIRYFQKLYQCELDKVSDYMKANGLSLSAEKSHMMLFNSGYQPKKLPAFDIEGTQIHFSDIVNFLGVHLSSKLTWKVHIQHC